MRATATHYPNAPHLPLEELNQVEVLRDCSQSEPIVECVIVQLVRGVSEGNPGEHPVGHAETAVHEALDINPENPRVQLSAPGKVLSDTP